MKLRSIERNDTERRDSERRYLERGCPKRGCPERTYTEKRHVGSKHSNGKHPTGINAKRKVSKRRTLRNKRKCLLRRIVIFTYRCICVGLAAGVLILAGKLWEAVIGDDGIVKDTPSVLTMGALSSSEYPESLLALAERNPEAKEFVQNYPVNKDKDFEIDLSEEVEEGSIPLFLQWDERWGYEIYGDDFLAVTGCGPTCLSMVRCGLSGDTQWNPLEVARLADEQGYYVDGVGSAWTLMTEGAAGLGLVADTVVYDEAHILAELEAGKPIICAMRPGDFTTSGHFIVLTGVDSDGNLTVCDPNSRANSEKSWSVEDLLPQIKNLWSYTYCG